MDLRTCLLTESDCYRRGRTIVPKGVMVHSTGANNPNLRRYVQPDDGALGANTAGNHWNRPGVEACVHAFIGRLADGSVGVYQTLPWTMRGWHAGGKANDTHIGFEICEDGLTDGAYFAQVYQAAVELTAHLCRLYNLDPLAEGVVICHSEGYQRGIASNHADVTHWFPRHGKSMEEFRADVARRMEGEKTVTYEEWKAHMDRYRAELGAKEASSWAKDALAVLKALGITDGKRPGDLTTREEVAAMIARGMEVTGNG